MFDKIIVPLDRSQTAQCVLPATICMATAFDAEVNLIHVLCTEGAQRTSQIDPFTWHIRKAESEMYLSSIVQALARHDLTTPIFMLEGEASTRIVSYAAQGDADLIILSSHGHTGLSSWNVSSVALKVLTRVHRSVLLIRAFHTAAPAAEEIIPYRFNNLLVPLDGSKRAESVLPLVDKLAQAQNSKVWLVHVATPAAVRPPFHTVPIDTKPLENLMVDYTDTAVHYLNQVQEQLTCQSETAVLHGGNIIATLNRFSDQKNIDLMLLCAHGHSNTKHAYGSVVTGAIVHGGASLFIFQDLPPGEIVPTHAEAASGQQDLTHSARNKKHAQPAYWTP